VGQAERTLRRRQIGKRRTLALGTRCLPLAHSFRRYHPPSTEADYKIEVHEASIREALDLGRLLTTIG
jgi:hypothetical protein